MRSVYQTTGRLDRGKLKVRNRSRIAETLKTWPDGELVITFERVRRRRSIFQNAFYWSQIVAPIAEETGETLDDTHAALKMLHLPKHLALCDHNGEIVNELVVGGSTRRLSVGEFQEYLSKVREWARTFLKLDLPRGEE